MRTPTPRNLLIVVIVALGLWLWHRHSAPTPAGSRAPIAAPASGTASIRSEGSRNTAPQDSLPREAHDVLRRIAAGGPFDHRQDGSVFQNRENRLPRQPRGYYHEYTVETPGSDDRGARRIVTGGDPPREYYYSDDHYRSFRRFDVPNEGAAR
ncbi:MULTISPECIES: ribonuclease domain-containing protein [Lysobacter]|uniref:Ribonuclease n=1 Tax=Lysobacter gummosus TaxID=262324 RepID=A0ABY3XCY3_9GAMM|nr:MULTISPECIES: ribonuclease domain-containing protein [Lysobacter]UJB19331.1 ribonuclease [Lysobacter capsici]UJQ26944.1 ribonuclease [Lysobacter gummosus]UNP29559.1 ribonuclease [Lysobacter gummosus]